MIVAQVNDGDEQIYPDPVSCFAMADHLYGEDESAPDHLLRFSLPGNDSDVDYPDGPTTLDGVSSTTSVEAIEFISSRNKLYAADGATLVYSTASNFNDFTTCVNLGYPDVDGLAYDGFDDTWYGVNHRPGNERDQIFTFRVGDDCSITQLSPPADIEAVQFNNTTHYTAGDLAIDHDSGDLYVVSISEGGGNTAVSNLNSQTGERSNTKFFTDLSDLHNETIYGIEGFTSTPDNFFLVSTGNEAKGYQTEELFALVITEAWTFEQMDLDDEQEDESSIYADTEAIACGQPSSYRNMVLGNKLFFDLDGNGTQEGNEPAIPGVNIFAWKDLNLDGTPDFKVAETMTNSQGEYLFERLGQGDFIIQVPCSEFVAGMVLEGHLTSSIVVDPDNNLNKDNNGYFDEFGWCALTFPVSLSFGDEQGPGGNSNTSVDIGFVPGVLNTDRIYEEEGGLLVMEAEEYESHYAPEGSDTWEIERSVAGAEQGVYLIPLIDDGTKIEEGYETSAPEVRYHAYFNTSGVYYVWYRAYGRNAGENSIHMGLNGDPLASLKDIGFTTYNEWTWVSTIDDGSRAQVAIPSAGEYFVNLWEREDGTKVDRIVLSTDLNFTPSGVGPNESIKNTKSLVFSGSLLLDAAWNGASMDTNLAAASLIPSLPPYPASPQTPDIQTSPNIVDWIRLELRTDPALSSKVTERAAYLYSDGVIRDWDGSTDIEFYGVGPGFYYLVADHKSHLAVMTAVAVDFTGASASFDFTQSLSSHFGSDGAVERDSKVLLWPGDLNGDHRISYSGVANDRAEILSTLASPSPFSTITAYGSGDVNMDGLIAYSGLNNDRAFLLNILAGNPSPFNVKIGSVPN